MRGKGRHLHTANTNVATAGLTMGTEVPCAPPPTRLLPRHLAIVTTPHDRLLDDIDPLKKNAFGPQSSSTTFTRYLPSDEGEDRQRENFKTSDIQKEDSFKTRTGRRRMRRQPESLMKGKKGGALLISESSKEYIRPPGRSRDGEATGDGASDDSTRNRVLVSGRRGSTGRVRLQTATSSVSLPTLKLQETNDQDLSSTLPGNGDELDR